MASGYRILPPVYDRWQNTYGKDYSGLILPRLRETIKKHRIPVSTMVDIACGTGSLAMMMARLGWRVWGVDASEGMIQVASAKLGGSNRRVTLLHQDMRGMHLPEPVTLATSMFDSVNHLLSLRDLRAMLRGAYGAIRPGGYFIFDTNNELCFIKLWTHNEIVTHKDFTLILKCSYRPRRRLGVARVIMFERKGKTYVRSEEYVVERCFSHKEVSRSLEEAGFQLVSSEDFNFSKVGSVGPIKTWWVARR